MPLLARLVAAPLTVDVRRGALQRLPELLADQRISTSGRVAVAVGCGIGPRVVERLRPALVRASWFTVGGGRSTPPRSWRTRCGTRRTTPWSASATAACWTPPSTPPPG